MIALLDTDLLRREFAGWIVRGMICALGRVFKLGGDCVKMKIDSPQGAATGGGPRPVPVAGTLRRIGLHFTRRAGAEAV